MKTTLDLLNDLVREMKLRTVHEGRKLRNLAADMIRRSLAQPERPIRAIQHRVKLPLIQCRHPAAPTMELTPNKVAEVFLKQEKRQTGTTPPVTSRPFRPLNVLHGRIPRPLAWA